MIEGWVRCWGAAARFPLRTLTYLAGKEVQLGDSGRLLVQACQLHTWCAISGGAVKETTRVGPPTHPFPSKIRTLRIPSGHSSACKHQFSPLSPGERGQSIPGCTPCQSWPWHHHPHSGSSNSNQDILNQPGIHQPPPAGTQQVRLGSTKHLQPGCPRSGCGQRSQLGWVCERRRQPRHAPAAGWGSVCAGTAALTRLVPAPSATPLGRNQGRNHDRNHSSPARSSPAWHPQHPQTRCSPQPGVPSALCSPSGHAVCWESLSLAALRCPGHGEPARRLCPAGQAGAVWQCWAQQSWQSQGTAMEFGESREQGMGMKQGARRGLSVLHAWGMPPILAHSGVCPHPKECHELRALRARAHQSHLSVTSMWDGGPSTGTPSCPRRPPRHWLPLNAGLSAPRSTQPGRGAPRSAPSNQ